MVIPHKNKKGFNRLYSVLKNLFEGLKALYLNKKIFRQELFLSLILIPVAFFTGDTTIEKTLLALSLILLIFLGLIDINIEKIVSLIPIIKNSHIRMARDIIRFAVLIAFLSCFFIWFLILFF